MSFQYSICDGFDFTARNLVSEEEARQQETIVREILLRLDEQPGVLVAERHGNNSILAALTVAASVTLADSRNRPAVVIAPPSEEEKWHHYFDFFRTKCLPIQLAANYRYCRAEEASQFFKFLDDPEGRKRSLIFLTPSAFHQRLKDDWIRLAFLQAAFLKIDRNRNLYDAAIKLFGSVLQSLHIENENLWRNLLQSSPHQWLQIFNNSHVDWNVEPMVDDPVPAFLVDVMSSLDLSRLTGTLNEALTRTDGDYRRKIHLELRALWHASLRRVNLHLPLLIFDNATLLKEKRSKMSELFRITAVKGPLAGLFERMLFLARLPFEMDHKEIPVVLQKFDSVAWDENTGESKRTLFRESNKRLKHSLDLAAETAARLEIAWTFLGIDDLVIGNQTYHDIDGWVAAVETSNACPVSGKSVLKMYQKAKKTKESAKEELDRWILEM